MVSRNSLIIGTALFALGAAAAIAVRRTMDARRFDPTAVPDTDTPEHWSPRLDAADRVDWQKPEELLEALGIEAGQRVADIGAGTGYLTRHLARVVGPGGTVFALDVAPRLVEHLRGLAEKEGWSNVLPLLSSVDNPRLPQRSLDLALSVNTYHHLDTRRSYFARVRAALAPGGRLVVVDWTRAERPVGPPADHAVAADQVVAEISDAGFTLKRRDDALLPHQYVLVFEPR